VLFIKDNLQDMSKSAEYKFGKYYLPELAGPCSAGCLYLSAISRNFAAAGVQKKSAELQALVAVRLRLLLAAVIHQTPP
jgi:hypothetical protein